MKLVLDVDVAWAAGVFEGEGCFSRGKFPSVLPLVSVAMTDRDIVERFAQIVGVGKTGPKTTRAPWKQQWHWWAQGDENFEYVALLFWPYLGQRRKARVEELRAQRTAYLAHRYRPRPCRECGEEFRPQTHAGIERAYCTVACSIKYHNNQRARAQCA